MTLLSVVVILVISCRTLSIHLLGVHVQVVVAIQMVVEEKFLGQYEVPALLAVGWEGIFGMGTRLGTEIGDCVSRESHC